MTSPAPAGRPSLKVPRENNRFLCFPAASQSKGLLDRNQRLLADTKLPDWFQNIRRLARQQALHAAKQYTGEYAPALVESISGGDEERQWVVGGHQPELFHPGVWFKNFLMSEISKQTNALALQVIVDHDVARSDSLRIPCGSSLPRNSESALAQRSIPLPIRPELAPRMPWHATRNEYSNQKSWDATILSVGQSIAECGLAPPLLQTHQKLLAASIASTKNIGDAFSRFRHCIEMDHGVTNLEVPIGHLCDESAFGLFVQHCVANAESLWTAYNQCRDEYRARHKIRNQGQPVLELQRAEEWLELPFWIYRRSGSHVVRNRLWVRQQADHYLLSDSNEPSKRSVEVELPFDVTDLPKSWERLVADGICIRPRALMTTMYLRCFVSDLFVHGIGGGTYDELTDDILLRWIGVVPPAYLISSASLYLPFASNQQIKPFEPLNTWSSIQRELHLMRSVPERFLDRDNPSHCELLESHANQLASIPPRGSKLGWHQRTVQIKHQMEMAIEPKRQMVLAKLASMQLEMQQNKIINSREYSFVLFDEKDVVDRLIKLARMAVSHSVEVGK